MCPQLQMPDFSFFFTLSVHLICAPNFNCLTSVLFFYIECGPHLCPQCLGTIWLWVQSGLICAPDCKCFQVSKRLLHVWNLSSHQAISSLLVNVLGGGCRGSPCGTPFGPIIRPLLRAWLFKVPLALQNQCPRPCQFPCPSLNLFPSPVQTDEVVATRINEKFNVTVAFSTMG